ncbi:MAG: entericidin, EcnA/B family [Akkermansiaceae bacterium]
MKIIKFFALSLVISALSGLTSCHTMAGMGRDLEKAANGIQNAIQR